MTTRLLVIGIDAAESTLIEKWAEDGILPNFDRLCTNGTVRSLENSLGTLPGAIWPEITSGQSGGKIGHFCTVNQIPSGESRYRPVTKDDVDPDINYWNIASEAGCRIAAIDQVQCALNPKINGIQVSEWGCHDRNFRTATHPPELLDEINSRHGPYPIQCCDAYPKNYEGYTRLLNDLLDGVKRKTAMLVDLLEREEWDLFTCTFGESHCAGHQLWHLHDILDASHDQNAPQYLKDALRSVYAEIDNGIGTLIEANGDSGPTLVFASHGMGGCIGGYQLIPELLARMGMSSDQGAAHDSLIRKLQNKVKNYVPLKIVPFLERRLARFKLTQRIQSGFGGMIFPLDSERTRAAFVPNNRVGGIRLNIKGREPNGCLSPGNEVAEVVDEIRREFFALRHIETDQPIVDRVMTAEEVFGQDHHPGIPDIMIVFNTKLGCIESCRSDRVGIVRCPMNNVRMARSGDHTPESRLWALGLNEPAGEKLTDGHVLDIAPKILSLLNIPIPPEMDRTSLMKKSG